MNILEAALAYAERGYSVLPLVGKKPAIDWTERQHKIASHGQIQAWERKGWLTNVGIVCGRISGNLVVIDLDGLTAIAAFETRWPDLLDTYTVATGSGRGKHLYYQADSLPNTTRYIGYTGNVELRANGCYVVAPPSLHPDTGAPYLVANPAPPRRLKDMQPVVMWIIGMIHAKQEQRAQRTRRTPAAADLKRTIGYERAARAALYYESRDVAAAREGARNETLHRAAYNLGQLVGDGLLTESEVMAALLGAALAAQCPPGEAGRTIKSGLMAGIAEPRSLQWQKRNT